MQDKTLTNLMETTLTNKTVLKRTSILQIKSTPNYWYVVGTDMQTFLQTQESTLLTTHLHILVGSTIACPVCSRSCPLSSALPETPWQNSSHVLANDPKLLPEMCKAKDCCSQSNERTIYSNILFLFTPQMDTWGESIRNITNRTFLFSTSSDQAAVTS